MSFDKSYHIIIVVEMETHITTEFELLEFAKEEGIRCTVADTNEAIGRELLRRRVLMGSFGNVPVITGDSVSSLSIRWEAMSCYLDAIIYIILQKHPSLDRFVWEMLTHRFHPV